MISQHVIEQSRAVVAVLGLSLAGCAVGFPAGEDPGALAPSSSSSTASSGLTGIAGTTATGTGIGIGTTGAVDAGTGTARAGRGGSGGTGAAAGTGAAGMGRNARAGSGAVDAGLDGAAPQDACQRLARCCSSVRDNSDQNACRSISQATDAAACDLAANMYCN